MKISNIRASLKPTPGNPTGLIYIASVSLIRAFKILFSVAESHDNQQLQFMPLIHSFKVKIK